MRAIILAAGRGSRMGGATNDRPKCLVEVGGRSLLSLQMSALRAAGIKDVAAVRGYRGDQLEGLGLTLFDNPRWQDSNMVVSLLQADPWLLESPCVISYSDIFYSAETVQGLAACSADMAISYDRAWLDLWSRRFADPLSDAETFRVDTDDRLVEIGGRATTTDQIQGQYMGLLKFTPRGWARIKAMTGSLSADVLDRLDMTALLSRIIAAGHGISTVPALGPWGEIDSESDLALYEASAVTQPDV